MDYPIEITTEELSKKGFGIFNGKLMGLGYNRELKRKYLKEHNKINEIIDYLDYLKSKGDE